MDTIVFVAVLCISPFPHIMPNKYAISTFIQKLL